MSNATTGPATGEVPGWGSTTVPGTGKVLGSVLVPGPLGLLMSVQAMLDPVRDMYPLGAHATLHLRAWYDEVAPIILTYLPFPSNPHKS